MAVSSRKLRRKKLNRLGKSQRDLCRQLTGIARRTDTTERTGPLSTIVSGAIPAGTMEELFFSRAAIGSGRGVQVGEADVVWRTRID